MGEKQLICLGRAILKNSRILVLDEATANVDVETDALIQRTLRLKLRRSTVLSVAHRLNTIIASDLVIVLQEGRLEQFGKPSELIDEHESVFRSMVEATGQADQLIGKIKSATY